MLRQVNRGTGIVVLDLDEHDREADLLGPRSHHVRDIDVGRSRQGCPQVLRNGLVVDIEGKRQECARKETT